MSALDAIDVVFGRPVKRLATDNALPPLHDIRHTPRRLSTTGEPATTNLSSIGFSYRHPHQLSATLGERALGAFGLSTGRVSAPVLPHADGEDAYDIEHQLAKKQE